MPGSIGPRPAEAVVDPLVEHATENRSVGGSIPEVTLDDLVRNRDPQHSESWLVSGTEPPSYLNGDAIENNADSAC